MITGNPPSRHGHPQAPLLHRLFSIFARQSIAQSNCDVEHGDANQQATKRHHCLGSCSEAIPIEDRVCFETDRSSCRLHSEGRRVSDPAITSSLSQCSRPRSKACVAKQEVPSTMFLLFTLLSIADLLACLLSSVREAPVGGKTSRCFKNFKLDPGPCSGNPLPPSTVLAMATLQHRTIRQEASEKVIIHAVSDSSDPPFSLSLLSQS